MGKILKTSNLKKTIHYLKKNGPKQTFYAVWERTFAVSAPEEAYEAPDETVLQEQRERGKEFHTRFSILVPAYETKPEYLRAMLDSVLAQTYGNFELILADAGASDQVEQMVKSYQDPRILYRRLKQNIGIAGNTEKALMYATGDYAALLDHDDILTPDALYEMAACIEEQERQGRELLLVYSDEDKLDSETGSFFEANRKYGFNLELLLSNNYICHFLVMKRSLMQELGFRSVCEGAQDYDLVLRAVSHMMGKSRADISGQLSTAHIGQGLPDAHVSRELPIAHIPKILYHWRCYSQSTAENPASKQYAYEAGKRAVEDFLRARDWKGTVSHMCHLGFYRVEYQPDIFANRSDVAVAGGRLLDEKNRIAGGIYRADGTPMYLGLHKEFSGYMHRACLMQEAEIVDVRCMKLSAAAEKVMEEILGLPCLKDPDTGRYNWRDGLKSTTDYVDLSKRFCNRVREAGYRIVWDPSMTEKLD